MNKRRLSGILFICLLVLFPLASRSEEAVDVTGFWEGKLNIPTMELEIQVELSRDGEIWKGTISIPAQNAKNLPLEKIGLSGNEITFMIGGVPGEPTFKGKLSDDGNEISGDFIQGGQSFPFSLKRESSPALKAKQSLAGFSKLVERGLKGLHVPGAAVAVVVGDKVLLAEGYGFRDVEKKNSVTADTLMAIGSSSKAFTTFAMGVLSDEGKMDWETPVRTYIPWFKLYDPFASERFTPRDLVTHRSGLPRHDLVWYNNTTSTREELVRRLAYLPPTADLRTKFQYNNMMFLTAGYLVETLTGKAWEDAIRGLVFEPLGMKRSNFSVDDSQQDADFAFPYKYEDKKLVRIPFRNITTVGPAGSINSCVREMSRWLLVHLNGGEIDGRRVIGAETIQDMHLAHMPTGGTPALPEVTPADYGMGWFIDSYKGHVRVHHGGNIDGFSALVSMLPNDNIGFVVLTNMNGTPLPELLVRHATDLILGLGERDWIGQTLQQIEAGRKSAEEAEKKKETRRVKGTRPAHKTAEYAGTYTHPGYGTLEISLEEENLFSIYNGMKTPLGHWHYETFNGLDAEDPTFEDMKYTFETDVNGRVAAVRAPFESAIGDIRFEKQPDRKLFDPEYLETLTGDYALATQRITVILKGEALIMSVPGQPAQTLVPALGGEFYLKAVPVISLSFKTDEAGRATALVLYQPNGVFEAARVKGAEEKK